MTAHQSSIVDEAPPEQAWALLNQLDSAAMVDVRTKAEWSFVGLPDLSGIGKPLWPIEWVMFPTMAPNAHFVEQLLDEAGGNLPGRIFFICRSGARSMSAAQTVAHVMQGSGHVSHCTNVAEGFEGDLNADGHRGTVNGWKAHGLPWRQS
ncbi:MAG: rhodanese-like domain-containing protein [Pseudomonadota bacterium]